MCNDHINSDIRLSNNTGVFLFNFSKYMTEVEREPTKQPRMFVNLKSNLINHELESKLHVSLKQKDYFDKKKFNQTFCGV